MSTALLGPPRSNWKETRLTMSPKEVRGISRRPSEPSWVKPCFAPPAYTPMRPRTSAGSFEGAYPASSRALQHSWRKSRTCGSVLRASCSVKPKSAGSNRSNPSRKAPHLEWLLRTRSAPSGCGS